MNCLSRLGAGPLRIAFLFLFVAAGARAQVPTIATYAGGGLPAAGRATATGITLLGGIGRDPSGNLYFSSFTGVVLKMDPVGNLSVFAGTGSCCLSGDGGLATSAQIGIIPYVPVVPVKTDPGGNVYIVDNATVVRRVDAVTGIITTVAGTPNSTGFSGAGGPATSAHISPAGLGFDAAGDLFISDYNGVVWRVDHVTQIITIVAGNGTAGYSGNGGLATSAELDGPTALAFDAAGDLFIADSYNAVVRRVDAVSQIITTVAGGGGTYPPTGVLATQAQLYYPTGLTVGPGGNLLIADQGLPAVLRVNKTTQEITVVAGDFTLGPGFSGDGGPATSAQLGYTDIGAMDLVVDPAGDIFFTDTVNYRVRRIDALTNIITTVAGNGTVGDGGPATSALLFTSGIAQDNSGNVFISDPVNRRVRRVEGTTGVISTAAGRDVESTPPPSGNGGLATAAQLSEPGGVALDSSGNLFIEDGFFSVRKVDSSTGIISLFAGTGASGFSGDGGPATSAMLGQARGLSTDSAGNLFIADNLNNVVRRVDASTHIITTVAGNTSVLSGGRPVAGYSGDGGPATSAQLSRPFGIFVDAAGNLFIDDGGNSVVRRVDAKTQIISTVAGNYALRGGFSGDNGPATAAALNGQGGVALDAYGNLYIADNGNYRVREVNAVTGIITTLAGNGIFTFAGDGGPAANASLWPYLTGLTTLGPGAEGNILVLVMDGTSGRTRVIKIPPVPAVFLTPAVGLSFGGQMVGTSSASQFVTVANSGTGTLNVTNVAVTGTGFVISPGGTCAGTNFNLAPTASCTIAVTFSPALAGINDGVLTIASNAPGGPSAIPLLGTGENLFVSQITQPLSPTLPNLFNFVTNSFVVQYPPGTSFSNVNMTVTQVEISQAQFQERVAGTRFGNATCIVYAGAGGNCADDQVTCSESGSPIGCPSEPTPTIAVQTTFGTSQAIINPGYLTTPIGENDWTNIFVSYSDPTVKAKTTGFSEFVAVDLGTTNSQGAGNLTLLAPLRATDPRAFGVGAGIPVTFQLTSIANPNKSVTDAVANLTIVMVSNASGMPESTEVLALNNAFTYESGIGYKYQVNTRAYQAGQYVLTIYGNAFAAQQVTFTIKGRVAATCVINSSSNQFSAGQSTTFTAAVRVPPSTGTPSGTITFVDSANSDFVLGTAPLVGGTASMKAVLQAPPPRQWIGAVYPGDNNFQGCKSPYIPEDYGND